MIGPPDVRVSVFNPLGALLIADGSADLGQVQYENTPAGCGAATLTLNLRYEEAFARGYWTGRNIVEISSGDDVLQAPITAGATKLYVTGTAGYDTAKGQDTGLLYLFDGETLTMRIPVTGVGTDGGGPYVTVGTPLGGGSIPAYAAGTLIGRRRYAGRVCKRPLANQKFPQTIVNCEAMLNRLNEAYGTFNIGIDADVDAGAAMYACLQQFFQAGRFPELTLATFPSVGTTYAGSATDTSVSSMCSNILNSISSEDQWELYIGHDRIVQLIKVYDGTFSEYVYPITLPQGVEFFEPVTVLNTDQDTSQQINSVKVIGSQDPATKQPVTGIGQDDTSIADFGQIDAQPVTNLSIKTEADADKYAQTLLDQYSAPRANAQFRVYTGPYNAVTQRPMGLDAGDVVLGVHAVTITRFDCGDAVKNLVPDSEFQWPNAPDNLWTLVGAIVQDGAGVGPDGSNVLRVTGTGTPSGAIYGVSSYIDVVPGQRLVLSGYIDATHVTAGAPIWGVMDPTLTTTVASVEQGAGNLGRVSTVFTVPPGVTQIVAICNTSDCTIASGQPLDFSQPQIELDSAGYISMGDPVFLDEEGALDTVGFLDAPITVLPDATAYVPNYGAPPLTGLVSSVQTTIIPGGPSYQDVQFAAIMPDWGSVMAQRANAMQTALIADTLQAPGLDQYFVSANAWPSGGPSTSGLTVTVPTFEAVFALGSQPEQVGGNSFALPAWNTSWAWLSPTNGWTIKQDTSFVAGSLLYGIFTTNGTSVIGSTSKVVIGNLGQPMSYLLNGVAFTPTFTGSSITISDAGSISSQITVAFEVTNQPTDGSFSKIIFWYRQSGQPTWLQLGTDVPRNASGTAQNANGPFTATGAYSFLYPDATNGLTYEFGFSLESGASTETSIISLGTIANTPVSVGNSALPPYGTNLIADSNFANSAFNIAGVASSSSYWTFQLIDGTSFLVAKGQAADGSNFLKWTSGASGSNRYGYSLPIKVVPGQEYVVSAYLDGRNMGTNGFAVAIVDFTSGSLGSTLASVGPTVGGGTAYGRFQAAWTCPSDGSVTQIVVLLTDGACAINNSTSGGAPGFLVAATPQFELSPSGQASTYKPTTGVLSNGTQAHTSMSSQTQSRVHSDSTLDVSTSPGPVTGELPLTNHAAAVQLGIGSTGQIIGVGGTLVTNATHVVGLPVSPPQSLTSWVTFPNVFSLTLPGTSAESYFVQLVGRWTNFSWGYSGSLAGTAFSWYFDVHSGTVTQFDFPTTFFDPELYSTEPYAPIFASFTAAGGQTITLDLNVICTATGAQIISSTFDLIMYIITGIRIA